MGEVLTCACLARRLPRSSRCGGSCRRRSGRRGDGVPLRRPRTAGWYPRTSAPHPNQPPISVGYEAEPAGHAGVVGFPRPGAASAVARDQPISPCEPRWSNAAVCSRRPRPALVQATNRRCAVALETPNPGGKCRHAQQLPHLPVYRNPMPWVNTAALNAAKLSGSTTAPLPRRQAPPKQGRRPVCSAAGVRRRRTGDIPRRAASAVRRRRNEALRNVLLGRNMGAFIHRLRSQGRAVPSHIL